MRGQIIIEPQDDGTIRIISRGLKGTTPEIMRELEALATAVGGTLTIEKHEPGAHSHDHQGDHVHN
jgi:hypothetical protein